MRGIKYQKIVFFSIWLIFSSQVWSEGDIAQDSEEKVLKGTTVIGNAEFPKVKYAFPWQTPVAENITVHPETQKDRPLNFIDRDTLKKKLQLVNIIQKNRKKK